MFFHEIVKPLGRASLRVCCIAAIYIVFSAAFVAYAQQHPSSEPILRVETGMHTAPIRRAAAEAGGGLLATPSWDKTVRLWSLATGDLVRILRPPIGKGSEGKRYPTAISPDGKWVATGGSTGYQWEKSDSIYVFEAASGRLARRITGLPNAIFSMAWSPDGQFVAVALAGKNGLSVFRTDDWQETARDTDYADASYGLAFDRSGRLAAASYDGYVRLYTSGFERIAKVKAAGGARPYAVAFSPDDTRLAVGYDDSNRVDILSARDLSKLASADTEKVPSGSSFSTVAWTKDGTLLAGGTYKQRDGKHLILRWAEGGTGAPQVTVVAARDILLSIIPLSDGGFVYASGDPGFGRLD